MDGAFGWESLFKVYEKAFENPETDRWFAKARSTDPALAGVANVGNLRQILKPGCGDPDRQDALLAGLIRLVQRGGRGARIADAILWIAFRPALDGIFRFWVKWFARDEVEYLVSHVAAVFVRQIHEADLSGIHRVAGTIKDNVERDVMRLVTRAWKDGRRWTDLPDDDRTDGRDAAIPADRFQHEPEWRESLFGMPTGLTTDQQITFLRARMAELVGRDDANMVVDAAVEGENQREMAEATGRNYDDLRYACRKARKVAKDLIEADPMRFRPPKRTAAWRLQEGN